MNTIINGIKCYAFGVNNYSCGLNPVTVKPTDHSIEEILSSGLFLNPFQEPNDLEVFCLSGTKEQFEEFVTDGKQTYATKKAVKEIGFPDYSDEKASKEFSSLRKKFLTEFKPWYEK